MNPANTDLKPLTPQQQLFVEHYCHLWKGAPAARAAGYAPGRAKQTANEMLRDARIMAAITKRADELLMSVPEATTRMSNWGRVSIEDVMTKEVVEYTPRIQKPFAQIVEEFEQKIEFEQEVAIATEAILEGKEQSKYRKRQKQVHQQRKIELLRMQLELARNPAATRWVNGETVPKEVARLDLVKVLDAQAGGLIKKVTPTKYGIGVELHDAKDATDKILKIHGAYAPKKIDFTNLSDEQVNELFHKVLENIT